MITLSMGKKYSHRMTWPLSWCKRVADASPPSPRIPGKCYSVC